MLSIIRIHYQGECHIFAMDLADRKFGADEKTVVLVTSESEWRVSKQHPQTSNNLGYGHCGTSSNRKDIPPRPRTCTLGM